MRQHPSIWMLWEMQVAIRRLFQIFSECGGCRWRVDDIWCDASASRFLSDNFYKENFMNCLAYPVECNTHDTSSIVSAVNCATSRGSRKWFARLNTSFCGSFVNKVNTLRCILNGFAIVWRHISTGGQIVFMMGNGTTSFSLITSTSVQQKGNKNRDCASGW